jgi:hypothetical protein
METVLIIVFGLFVGMALLVLTRANRRTNDGDKDEKVEPSAIDPACCGAHEICEFDEIKAKPDLIEYFDDEELDQLKAVHPDQYSEEQIDQLREVLYTLKTAEIKNWLLSLERRHIHLPEFLKQEARDLQMSP